MRRSLALAAILAAACGGLESPDLSTGAIAGRVEPSYAGGRAYVLGRPELRAALAADGSFTLAGVPVGAATVVVFDGLDRAGALAATVRGADVTWVGPAPRPDEGAPVPPTGSNGEPGSDGGGGPLPLAGAIVARAVAAPGGAPLASARFDVAGTELAGVAAGDSGEATLAPLPPGTFEVVARAEGHPEARLAVEVRAGETPVVELALE